MGKDTISTAQMVSFMCSCFFFWFVSSKQSKFFYLLIGLMFLQRAVVDEIIKAGRRLANRGRCPLMYEWHGKKYWGAAHGLAGIMHVLMDMELKPDQVEDVKGTLRYMIKNRFPSGNYPSSEGSESDRLVHWCHGAPGVTLTLAKAAEVILDEHCHFHCCLIYQIYCKGVIVV